MTRINARQLAALLTSAARRAGGPGMGRDISLVLIFKLAALGVLWALFFSDAHQPSADPAATSRRLALAAAVRTAATANPIPPQERSRD